MALLCEKNQLPHCGAVMGREPSHQEEVETGTVSRQRSGTLQEHVE